MWREARIVRFLRSSCCLADPGGWGAEETQISQTVF